MLLHNSLVHSRVVATLWLWLARSTRAVHRWMRVRLVVLLYFKPPPTICTACLLNISILIKTVPCFWNQSGIQHSHGIFCWLMPSARSQPDEKHALKSLQECLNEGKKKLTPHKCTYAFFAFRLSTL